MFNFFMETDVATILSSDKIYLSILFTNTFCYVSVAYLMELYVQFSFLKSERIYLLVFELLRPQRRGEVGDKSNMAAVTI